MAGRRPQPVRGWAGTWPLEARWWEAGAPESLAPGCFPGGRPVYLLPARGGDGASTPLTGHSLDHVPGAVPYQPATSAMVWTVPNWLDTLTFPPVPIPEETRLATVSPGTKLRFDAVGSELPAG